MPKFGSVKFARGEEEAREATQHLLVHGFERIRDATEDQIWDAAELSAEYLHAVTNQFVPKKTGALRETGQTTVYKNKKGNIVFELSYGDPASGVDYAMYVHENKPTPPAAKNYTTPGTGPYYLINGWNAAKDNIQDIWENIDIIRGGES